MKKYFYDSYAIIELVKGNSSYSTYTNEEITLSIFNLVEIYSSILRDFGEEIASKNYDKFKRVLVELDDETLKGAVKFRAKNKKKKLSYTDCIGYIYALRNSLIFLTGDKEFEGMKNVEFVK